MTQADGSGRGEQAHVILWEYTVKPGLEAEFERAYGPGGGWIRFFRRSADYLATELYRDQEGARRYVTVDRWQSRAAYEAFLKENMAEYMRIDQVCAEMTESERRLGAFVPLG